MSKYICGAVVDIGVERESQEDYVQYREFGDNLFCVVADGAGSQKGFPQPAVIAVSDILETHYYYIKKRRSQRRCAFR